MAVTPKRNPFVATLTGTDIPASEQKAGGVTSKGGYSQSNEAVANSNGEINAYNKRDAFQQIANIVSAAQKGQIQKQASARETLDQLASDIRTASLTRSAANFGTIGEEVTNEIRTTISRTGFLRRFAQERELKVQEECKVYIRKQDTLAFSMSTDGQTPVSHIKQRELYLRENYIESHILIEEKELARLGADLLEEKLEDGMEMVMVQEDRQWKTLADQAAATLNVPTFFSSLTPAVYQSLKNQVENRGLPVSNCWMANNLMNDLVADPTFASWFDPVTKHEIVLTGELGSLLGVTMHTDAFINSQLRVLQAGEIYFFSHPKTLGQFLVRQGLVSEPINKNVLGIPARGWLIREIVAPVIVNANGVNKGTRL
jgi:hypothetical protein